MNITDQIQADKELIEQFGGPTKLAELLGYDTLRGGVQRVQNWKVRGIPPRVRLDRPDLFQEQMSRRRRSQVKPP